MKQSYIDCNPICSRLKNIYLCQCVNDLTMVEWMYLCLDYTKTLCLTFVLVHELKHANDAIT